MPGIQITIRDLLKAAVTAAAPTYAINVLDIEAVFLPKENLENIGTKPFVKFVAVGFMSNTDRILRNRVGEVEVPVQIAVQKRVANAFDDVEMSQLVDLCEQIQLTCENDFMSGAKRYTWLRTEPLRDENNLTYSYQELMSQGVFQSIFNPVFKFIRT